MRYIKIVQSFYFCSNTTANVQNLLLSHLHVFIVTSSLWRHWAQSAPCGVLHIYLISHLTTAFRARFFPTMPQCVAYECYNISRLIKAKGISFYRFPRKNPSLIKAWIAKLQLKDPWLTPDSRVCSDHFSDECFVLDLRPQLLGSKPKEEAERRRNPHDCRLH